MSKIDGRRSQWFAVDSMFFGSSLAQDVMERFGPSGIAVWFAFLAACKRNLVPGQITVLSDSDCLAQLGLSGMKLVDNEGNPYELSDYWRRLGELHTTSRRRHGAASTIVCRRWDEWQTNLRRENDAERKSRSRAKNARDIGVTDKTETRQGQGQETDSQVSLSLVTQGSEQRRDPRAVAAVELLADVDLENAQGARDIRNPDAYRATCLRDRVRLDLDDLDALAAAHPTAGPDELCTELARRRYLA